MKRQVNVLIEEDCFPGLDYAITVNGKDMHKSVLDSNRRKYTANINCKYCNIVIQRDEEWASDSKLDKLMHILNMLDFMFGCSAENLPINVQYARNIEYDDDYEICIAMKQSDILHTTVKDVNFWNKCALFQILVLGLIICILGVLMSFLFNGLLQWGFIVVILTLDILLFIALNRRVSKLREQLLTLLK